MLNVPTLDSPSAMVINADKNMDHLLNTCSAELCSSRLYGTLVPGTLPRYYQYSRSGSFWASRIRIRYYLYGSGSWSGSFLQQAKKCTKTLIWFQLFRDLLSVKTDGNVPLISNEHKKLGQIFFVSILKATEEKSRIQIGIRIQIPSRIQIRNQVTDPRIRIRLKMWRI